MIYNQQLAINTDWQTEYPKEIYEQHSVTSCCSFTAHSLNPNIAWPTVTDWQVINCAEMASGNSLT